MRVLFCTLDYPPSAASGGAEQQARLQAEELVRRGHRVDVVCARTRGHRSETLNGVRVHRLHRLDVKYIRGISYLFMLAAFLPVRIRRYDLVHVHLANLQADIAVAIARMAGRPTYLKVAAGGPLGEIGRMRVISWLTRYFGLRHADAVQAISDEIADDLRGIGVPMERIHRIPNGVVVPARPASDDRIAARHELGLDANGTVILYVGRMEHEKGVDDLVHAWRVAAPTGVRLVLLGRPGRKDPANLDALPAAAEYRDWTVHVDRYLAAADVFALASHAEGMSNALLEAMAAGLACVATKVGAAPEMIRDGESGLLVTPKDIGGLTRALRAVLDDGDLRDRLGQRARESVSAAYGIGPIVNRIEEAYETVGVA